MINTVMNKMTDRHSHRNSSRFDVLFNRLNDLNGKTSDQKAEGAFVPFVTLCDPDLDRSFEIICTLVDNGADALELGFPFSDPLLDGEVIQAANQRALSAGYSTDASFELLQKVRAEYPEVPISLLLCANLIFAQGLDEFYKRCADTGVDAVLVADVPLMECESYCKSASKYGVQPVLICPPNVNTDLAADDSIAQIAKHSQGYTYLVSRAGVTSAENQKQASNLDELITKLKESNAPPVLQGFGISSPEQVKLAIENGCSGAISGSAIVKIIETNLDDQQVMLGKLADFVISMKAATV